MVTFRERRLPAGMWFGVVEIRRQDAGAPGLKHSFWKRKDPLLLDKQARPSNMGETINHYIP